jgi:hypothetical protein
MNQPEPTITIPIRFLESIDLEGFGNFVLESVQYKHERAFGRWLRDLDPDALAELFAIMSGADDAPAKPDPIPPAKPPAKKARAPKAKPAIDEPAEQRRSSSAFEWLEAKGSLGASAQQFENQNGLTTGQAKGLLKRWIDGGLVVSEKEGRAVTYRVAPQNGAAAHAPA